MSYNLDFSVILGSGQTGLTLEAKLVDSSGTQVNIQTSGFTEIGNGNYLWNGVIPDGHQGGVVFYAAGTSAPLAFSEINPPLTAALPSDALDNIMVEQGVNLRQALSIIGAALAGTLRLVNGNTVQITGLNIPDTRITAVVNSNGERLNVSLTLP